MQQPASPRRILTRSLAAASLVAGLGTAYAVGAAGSDDGPTRPGDAADTGEPGRRPAAPFSPAAFAGSGLTAAGSCEDLLASYVAWGVDRVTANGWDYYYDDVMYFSRDSATAPVPLAARAPAAELSQGVGTSRQVNGETGTNVQEIGVDEPDVVKTNGSTLFRVQGGDLVTYDLTGRTVRRLATTDLPGLRDPEILLAGDTVVAIGADTTSTDRVAGATTDEPTRVTAVDVSDPASPQVTTTASYRSALVTARLHGDVVRLVLQAGLPDLPFESRGPRHQKEALRANRELVEATSIEDWLPTVTVDGGEAQPLLDCDQVAVPDGSPSLGTVAVVGFTADQPQTHEATGLAVNSNLVYASADRLYLATSAYDGTFCCVDRGFAGEPSSEDDGTSHLYAFALDGTSTTFAAAGDVDGSIADRWSLDEADGVLRVAVGATQATGNFSSIVTFREDGNHLVELGRLDRLGVNETMQSMRWFDGLAIMVTFRQVDPLYAIDLSDPARPELIGSLKIPGFSSYLHPLGTMRLVGVGEGPTGRGWGAQMGLFDVNNLTRLKQLDTVSYGGGTTALATTDPRQLTWLPGKRTVLSVVVDYGRSTTGFVSVVHLEDGRMDNRMVRVEYGDDVDQVRLVPLPDDRVVLVTGDDARFFAV